MALIGAYVLAGELSRDDDVHAALTRYEGFMRSEIVDFTPPIQMKMLRRANPQTRAGIRVLHNGARVMTSPAGKAVMNVFGKRFTRVSVDGVQLPDYPTS
jgi:hypothetical protein